jgi:hypothetical protein
METNLSHKTWKTTLSLVLSGLGILYFLGQTIVLALVWLSLIITPVSGFSQGSMLGLLVWSSILSAFILLPIFLISLYQQLGKPIPHWLDTDRPLIHKITWWSLLIWPLLVLLGWLVSGSEMLSALLLGLINVLIAGIPVLWIYHAAQRKLQGGSQIRKWRIFGFSLTVMPTMILIVELIAILALVVVGSLVFAIQFSTNPGLEQQLMQFFESIMSQAANPDALLTQVEPYLLQPAVIFVILAIFAGIMPLIEEILKPLALWTLAGSEISPQEGFVGGLLCGAGFALMENILYFSTMVTTEDWLLLAVGRAGTGVLHMLASGLAGWGLSRAWRDRKWGILVLTTLASFILHGLWNALALLSGIAPILLGIDIENVNFWQTVLYNLPVLILLVLSGLGLGLINQHFRKQDNATSQLMEG